jgi:hypothetical protein
MLAQKNNWVLFQKTLDFLRLSSRAYRLAFPNPESSEVLKDLAKFCHIGKAPFHPDQRKTDILIGRQEVFFRIADHLNLQPDELFDIYNKPTTLQPQAKE